jgi:hypothetical protein
MSTMFATMGSGKLVGLGAGGAVSSLVVYRRAESARDASTADRARGRRRAAEKQRLAEKAKEAASTRRDAGDDAGGSTTKALAPAATAPAVAAAGTASAAPEKTVAPESRVGANPDDAAEETVVETEVDMRPKRTRKPRERKKTRTVAPIAAVAAPFGLLVARNLFRHFMSRGVKKGDAAKTASNENPRTKKSLAASEPILSLRAKAAIARAGSVTNPLSSTDANRLAELDRVIGFQAKELRFMRVTLAEKDKRIAQLLRARVAAPVVDEREKRIAWRDDDEREMSRIEPNDDDDAYDLDATVDMTVDMTVDEVLRELAEEKNQTVAVREEKEKRATGLAVASRRASVVNAARPAPPVAAKGNGVPFAARGKENEELSMKTRLAGRFLDVSDEDSDETPVSRRGALGARNADTTRSRVSFLDPAVRVARGKSRVHRISPTRRQRETERAVAAESSLRLVR